MSRIYLTLFGSDREKVNGMKILDREKFSFKIDFPGIKLENPKEIKNITKMVKKLKIALDRPNFKPVQNQGKLFLISPEYFEKREKLEELERFEIVKVSAELKYENFSAAEILDMILPAGLPRVSGFGTIG